MKKTMLTYETLDRFEREFETSGYTDAELEKIEHAAYVANMNKCAHPEWTKADIFADFLRVLRKVFGIRYTAKPNAFYDLVVADVAKSFGRSAWDKGVREYASDLLDGLYEGILNGYINIDDLHSPAMLDKALLNGASDWDQYSWGGCSLIYDGDIAERLCTPSELKKTRNGERRPNRSEEWLDVQARALRKAAYAIKHSMYMAIG